MEAILAAEVRRYLSVSGHGDRSERDALLSAAMILGTFVERLLEANDLWGSSRWVDSITPSSEAEVVTPSEMALDGLLIFADADRGTQEWWEPFYARLRISETNDEILSYELKVGDAAWGLGKVRYNEHPRGWNWSRPEKWIFVFSKS